MNRLCRTKASNSARAAHALPRSLIEQSSARRAEMPDESTTGMIPGDRGMVGGNWCRLPLRRREPVGRHISPVPLAGVVSGQSTHEIGTVPPSVIRNRAEWSQAHGTFRPVRRRSYPQRLRLLLRRPARQCATRRDDPAKRPRSPHEQGAQGKHAGGESTGLGKAREPPHGGGVKTHVTPLQSPTQPER